MLGVGLVSLSVFITLYYHYLQDPAFHQNAYTILTVMVLTRAMYVMEVNIRPKFRSKERERANPRLNGGSKAAKEREDLRDKEILRTMWNMVAFGLTIFLSGYAIWGIDNHYCSWFVKWRRVIGLPWGLLLEGHGWW